MEKKIICHKGRTRADNTHSGTEKRHGHFGGKKIFKKSKTSKTKKKK